MRTKSNSRTSSMACNNECRISADIIRPASPIFSTISRAVTTYSTERIIIRESTQNKANYYKTSITNTSFESQLYLTSFSYDVDEGITSSSSCILLNFKMVSSTFNCRKQVKHGQLGAIRYRSKDLKH